MPALPSPARRRWSHPPGFEGEADKKQVWASRLCLTKAYSIKETTNQGEGRTNHPPHTPTPAGQGPVTSKAIQRIPILLNRKTGDYLGKLTNPKTPKGSSTSLKVLPSCPPRVTGSGASAAASIPRECWPGGSPPHCPFADHSNSYA